MLGNEISQLCNSSIYFLDLDIEQSVLSSLSSSGSGRGRRDILAVPPDKVSGRVVVGDDDDLVGLGLGLRDAHLLAALPNDL